MYPKEGDPNHPLFVGVNKKQSSWLVQTNEWKLAYTQSERSQDKTLCVKACTGFKTATDAVMREQRMLVFYAELRGGKAT